MKRMRLLFSLGLSFFATQFLAMELQLPKKKSNDMVLSFESIQAVFTPLPIRNLDALMQSDSHIGSYLDQYQRVNYQYFKQLKGMFEYELLKISNEKDAHLVQTRLQVINTALEHFEVDKYADFRNSNSMQPPMYNGPTSGEKVIHRGRDIIAQHRNNSEPAGSRAIAIKLHSDKKGRYVVIDGMRQDITEGKHIEFSGHHWVAVKKQLIQIAPGKAILDTNGNCHMCDLDGNFHTLIHGKDQWVTWIDNHIYLYKNGRLHCLGINDSIELKDGEFVNIGGRLCPLSSQHLPEQVMQSDFITTLNKSANNSELLSSIDAQTKAALAHAAASGYVIPNPVEWQLKSSQQILSSTDNAHEFVFHLATVEHLSNDIQVQVAQTKGETLAIFDRSSTVLAHAMGKYLDYLSPTEGEISFIIDLARYVSDVTIGTEYLSAEVCDQRIAQFWNMVDALSFEKLSNLSVEQFIDNVAYVAARATYVAGARATIALIKNVESVGEVFYHGARAVARRFMRMFDSVISNNPSIITDDGSIIWNASQEVVQDARQLVQAFNSTGDQSSKKSSRKIIDDTKKVIENESKLKPKTVDDLISESTPGETSKGRSVQYNKTGSYEDALNDFEAMNLKDIDDISREWCAGKRGKLEDGRTVVVRETSKGKIGESGPPTLEIQKINCKDKIKFRYKMVKG